MTKTPQSLSLPIDKDLYDKKSNNNPSRLANLTLESLMSLLPQELAEVEIYKI